MKRYGEAILNIYRMSELVEHLNNTSDLKVIPIENDKGEVSGFYWDQKGMKITLIVAGKINNETEWLENSNAGNITEISNKSKALSEKLFVPWELHLPVYIIVESKDTGDAPKEFVEATIKAYIRIIAEELMETVGAWIPEDEELVFSTDTWSYDVKLHKLDRIEDVDVTNLKYQINSRGINTKYYTRFL